MQETIDKADKIFEDGNLKLISSYRGCFHWKVKQSDGEFCEVWYRNRDGVESWECDSVTWRRKDKTGGKWGCVMQVHKQGRHEPFCSHTLACKHWVDKYNKIETGDFFGRQK